MREETAAEMARALTRIASAMERMTTMDDPGPAECQHDQRNNFGITNGVEDWQCLTCGHRSIPEVK